MKMRTLIALAIATGFAATAQAEGDKAAASGNTGAEKMFQAMDKDKDGSVSKEEAKGTPHDKDFSMLDKDGDGKLSREEHAAAPEHASDKAASGGTGDRTPPQTGEPTKKY